MERERLEADVRALGLPTGKATLAEGLSHALTHGLSKAPRVEVLIDPVSGWARTTADELLPPSTLAQILRTLPGRQTLPRIRPVTAADLTRHDQGRRTRVVAPAQRALLGRLDGEHCRFPGCTRTHKLQAHHVVFWRNGGVIDLANLTEVCR